MISKSYETAPAKGWSAVNKGWFIGYKLHVIIFDNGVVQQSGITKANVHDINFLKQVKNLPTEKKMLGDRAYISKTLQMDLFEQYKVTLKVPF
ncbi:MAG: transposase [Chitinophagaceae bacterium]|nr:transposase [Chitinophagaceae bacterium]